MKHLTAFFLMLIPASALAQEIPGEPVDPAAMVTVLLDAIGSGNWGLGAAAGVLLIVFVLRKWVFPNVNSAALPWIAVGIGLLFGFGSTLLDGQADYLKAAISGISLGLMAAGEWGLLGVLRKDKKADPALKSGNPQA